MVMNASWTAREFTHAQTYGKCYLINIHNYSVYDTGIYQIEKGSNRQSTKCSEHYITITQYGSTVYIGIAMGGPAL